MKGLYIHDLADFKFPAHPRIKRKMRHRYQNLSLAGKLRWRAEVRHMHASLIQSGVYNEKTGGLDFIAMAKRSKRVADQKMPHVIEVLTDVVTGK